MDIFGFHIENLSFFFLLKVLIALFLVGYGIYVLVTGNMGEKEREKFDKKYTKESVDLYAKLSGVLNIIVGIFFFVILVLSDSSIEPRILQGGPYYITLGAIIVIMIVYIVILYKVVLKKKTSANEKIEVKGEEIVSEEEMQD